MLKEKLLKEVIKKYGENHYLTKNFKDIIQYNLSESNLKFAYEEIMDGYECYISVEKER